MNANSPTVPSARDDDPALGGEDTAAVLDHLTSGKPLDPGIEKRVRTRAEQVTADIRRERGLVDDDTFQSLLDDEG